MVKNKEIRFPGIFGFWFNYFFQSVLYILLSRRSDSNNYPLFTNRSAFFFSQELRAPLDVINLGIVFGIPQQFSRDLVIKNGQAAVTHGDIRARTHKGIIRVTVNDHKNGKDGGASSDKDSVKV